MSYFGILEAVKIWYERRDRNEGIRSQNQILLYAIISESRSNNDIASIIYKNRKMSIIQNYPKIFNQFSTVTSDILLSTGQTAKVIFEDKEEIKEVDFQKIENKTYKKLNQYSSSMLYEFYIRKCNLLKTLYAADALTIPNINVAQRCKNIEYATRILNSRFAEMKKTEPA